MVFESDIAPPVVEVTRQPDSRRERLKKDRTRRVAVMLVAAIAGTVAGVVSKQPTTPGASTTVPNSTTSSPHVDEFATLFIGHRTNSGTLDFAIIFGVDPTRADSGVALLIPPETMVQVPALQTQVLEDLPAIADDDILVLTIMNATGIRIDNAIIANDTAFAKLLAPAEPLTVELRSGVRIDDDEGTLGYPSGTHELAATEAYRALLGSEPDGSLAHLVTVQAVMAGWLDRLANPKIAKATTAVNENAGLLSAVGGDAVFWTLPVELVDAGEREQFRLLDEDLLDLVVSKFGAAALSGGTRPRAQLRNGTGTVGITQAASHFVIPIGIEVAFTDNVVGFGQKKTTVIYYRSADEASANAVVKALGVGSAVQADRDIDVVDLAVVLGADFEAKHLSK